MYKAVIFDLNGVFLESQFLTIRFKERYGVAEEKFFPALKKIMNVVRKPEAPPAYSLWQPYFILWQLKLSENEFFDFWFSGEHLVPELLDYANHLRQNGTKVFILSNNFRERTLYYRRHFPQIFSSVDKSYFSWETGFVKPSPESLKLVLTENNLNPQDCIYFDDSDANLNMAKSLGIYAIKWTNLPSAKKLIENLK